MPPPFFLCPTVFLLIPSGKQPINADFWYILKGDYKKDRNSPSQGATWRKLKARGFILLSNH